MTPQDVRAALDELRDVVRCRCHEAYTGRGLHDPDCECDSADSVETVAAAYLAQAEEIERLRDAIEYVRADRIEALEAERDALAEKLARAVEDLQDMLTIPNSEAAQGILKACARAIIAELAGSKND